MQKTIELTTPLCDEAISQLNVGDVVSLTGYIYTGYLSVKERAFSSLSIFDSMSLLVAMIVIVVICVPLYLLRGAVESIMMSGCTGMASAVILVIILLYVIYQLIEKILFELFIINLPY